MLKKQNKWCTLNKNVILKNNKKRKHIHTNRKGKNTITKGL